MRATVRNAALWLLILALPSTSLTGGGDQPGGRGAPATKPPPASQPDGDSKVRALPNQAAGETDKGKIVRFAKPTPEQAKAAVEEARAKAEQIVRQLKIRLRFLETPHFLIYTEWARSDDRWLETTFEQMYRGLAKQFGIDPKENIWYGKLPIYVFSRREAFVRFVKQIDKLPGLAAEGAGYAYASGDGRGHIVMWRAGGRRTLSSLIVHEGTHAFLARYRTNLHIVSWLNEGLAQMMEQVGVPNSTKLRGARTGSLAIARRKVDIRTVMTEEDNIPFEMYPVAMTLTDLLLKKSKRKYVAMIDDIKDGMEVEAALKKNYGWDYTKLAKWWYKWAKRGFK